MINPIVKKHLLKFGLSQQVLQTFSDMVTSSLDENATDDEILESVKTYETLAKSFQSEVTARVAKARNGQPSKDDATTDAESGSGEAAGTPTKMEQLLEKLVAKVEGLETAKTVEANVAKAAAQLKELKMTQSEIDAALYGRSFTSDEEVSKFVEKQGEFYADILKDRVDAKLGEGGKPPASNGSTTSEKFKQDVESFNKKF